MRKGIFSGEFMSGKCEIWLEQSRRQNPFSVLGHRKHSRDPHARLHGGLNGGVIGFGCLLGGGHVKERVSDKVVARVLHRPEPRPKEISTRLNKIQERVPRYRGLSKSKR